MSSKITRRRYRQSGSSAVRLSGGSHEERVVQQQDVNTKESDRLQRDTLTANMRRPHLLAAETKDISQRRCGQCASLCAILSAIATGWRQIHQAVQCLLQPRGRVHHSACARRTCRGNSCKLPAMLMVSILCWNQKSAERVSQRLVFDDGSPFSLRGVMSIRHRPIGGCSDRSGSASVGSRKRSTPLIEERACLDLENGRPAGDFSRWIPQAPNTPSCNALALFAATRIGASDFAIMVRLLESMRLGCLWCQKG